MSQPSRLGRLSPMFEAMASAHKKKYLAVGRPSRLGRFSPTLDTMVSGHKGYLP